MFDPIKPPAARRPEEALELVSQALSDGDLEAALAQYEKQALLACWPLGGAPGDSDVRAALAGVMALRLPLYLRVVTVLEGPELALVICVRRIGGTGPDGERVWFAGHGCAALRPQPDGAWRIAADAWRVSPDLAGTELPPDPPEIPPGTAGDPVSGEGQGGQPHH
jgi:ketosteroid isomerase-like protein